MTLLFFNHNLMLTTLQLSQSKEDQRAVKRKEQEERVARLSAAEQQKVPQFKLDCYTKLTPTLPDS